MMEEYRPWVVDRNVIKLRSQLKPHSTLDAKLKRKLSSAIHSTMGRRLQYQGRKLKLESILQRQAYRLASVVVEGHRYKPFRFRW